MEKRTSGMAIASFVLGIVGIISWWMGGFVISILAVIFGIIGLREVKRSPDQVTGYGLALAGFILGVVTLAISVIAMVFWWMFIWHMWKEIFQEIYRDINVLSAVTFVR